MSPPDTQFFPIFKGSNRHSTMHYLPHFVSSSRPFRYGWAGQLLVYKYLLLNDFVSHIHIQIELNNFQQDKVRSSKISKPKSMEGLIPYLLHAIKKTRPQHKYRTSFSGSGNSNRSYHLLTSGNDSLEGSSHRRTRSELPAPAAADLFEQRSELHQFAYSRSYKEEGGASAAAASLPGGSKKGFYPYRAANRKYE